MNYNGYRNYETWNVALFISNDYEAYQEARKVGDYNSFVTWMALAGIYETKDKVKLKDNKLDVLHLNEVIEEL